MFSLTGIPSKYWFILILLLVVCGLVLLLFFRRKEGDVNLKLRPPRHLWGWLAYLFRLAVFGLLMLVVIGGGLMFYIDYQSMINETAPARRTVALPDLPFTIETVRFSGGDGIQLAGWYVPSRNDAVVILLHGYGGTRVDMLWYAETLVKAGYGVLMYDERASGESTGDHRSYGWEDAPDVGGAIAFLKDRNERGKIGAPVKIGIAGCSIGGQIALQGAVYYPEIQAVWADGPSFILTKDSPSAHNVATGLLLVSNHLLDALYVWHRGIEAPPAMVEIIGQIAPRPVMLVGGGKEIGPYGSEAPRMYRYAEYAGPNAQVWIIPAATHCDGPMQAPDEYAQQMVGFFDEAMK